MVAVSATLLATDPCKGNVQYILTCVRACVRACMCACMYVCMYVCMHVCMLNKNSLAVKKCEANQKPVQKGGQVTKPIIVVKMPCKLLYVIQVKGFLINVQLLGLT